MAQTQMGVVMNMQDRQIDDIITLNVGGNIYSTTRPTLLKYSNSYLAVLVINPNHIIRRDKDGHIFIDRNGKHFEYILDFLRDEQNIPPRPLYRQVLQEASFYGISDHIRVASRRKNEITGAAKIRLEINAEVNYETLINHIMQKGPKYLLTMVINKAYNIERVKPTFATTGETHLGSVKSEIESQSIVSCLWRDIRSDGFDVDIDIWRCYNTLYCLFSLKDVS